ncbi:MAG: chemotaxis protein CheW [Pirellulaceae bacterium]|nr:purine-binding chemotaxis protein CheW [Planctomycetales bacterium]
MTALLEDEATGTADAGASQFLTFALNDQEFGIEILRVQEIKNFTRLTPIPNMPECIKGVMNLRGTVVPIVDLRAKFNMPATEYNQFTVIIVVNVGTKIMGLVVDAVSDVLNVGADSIEGPPDLGDIDTSFITGLAKSGERLVTLLNIEQLLGDQQPATVGS